MFKISGSLHSTVPISVVNTIDLDAPTHGSTHDTCRDWLDNYNCTLTRNSLFFKGPLLKIDPELSQTLLSPTSLLSIKALRGNIKRTLLDIQKRGDFNEWQSENFILFNIKGLRQSSR